MSDTLLVLSIDTTIKLLVLWVLIYWAYRPYRIDSLRQRLFALRDELFDLAADGHIEFSDPAYWRLRLAINGMIRFAHRISFARLVFTSVLFSPVLADASSYVRWRESVKRVDSAKTQERLRQIHHQMSLILVRHMVSGSVVLMIAFAGVFLSLVVKGMSRAISEGVAEQLVKRLPNLSVLEDEAVEAHNYRVAA